MTFDEYQKESRKTAIYPNIEKGFVYPTLGLAGEAGEVAEKVKRILRDDGGEIKKERVEEIKKELGDVLWYIAQLAAEFNLSFEDVAQENLRKLQDRNRRGAVTGSGDNR